MKQRALVLLLLGAVCLSNVQAQLKETALVATCDDMSSATLLSDYTNCQYVDQTQLPGKPYYFIVPEYGQKGLGFDFMMTIRYVKGTIDRVALRGPPAWNETKCGDDLSQCMYSDETSTLLYLDRSVLVPGKYQLAIVPTSYASFSVRVETPGDNPLLDPNDVAAMRAITAACCPPEFDSLVCKMLRKGTADNRSDKDDVCHQRPNVCDKDGRLTKLVLRGGSSTGRIVSPGLNCASFPKALEQLDALDTIDISNNMLRFNASDVAAVTSALPKLNRIIARNNLLQGFFPCEFVTEGMVSLWLDGNEIKGQLPDCVFQTKNLQILSLSKNSLSGGIPDLPKTSPLALLNLGLPNTGYGLKGPIPPTVVNLKALWTLDLTGNQLTGSIPDFPLDIQNIDLNDNLLEGEFPPIFMKAKYLTSFRVGNNKLEGPLPKGRVPSKFLSTLDLSKNNFTGALLGLDLNPVAESLISVDVSDNKLGGLVPAYLAKMPQLVALDLSNNLFEGSLQLFADMLNAKNKLTTFLVGSNNLDGTVPKELETLLTFSEDGVATRQAFDISNNQLTGPWPMWVLKHLVPGRQITMGGNKLECPEKINGIKQESVQLITDFDLSCWNSKVNREIHMSDAVQGRITQNKVVIKRGTDPKSTDTPPSTPDSTPDTPTEGTKNNTDAPAPANTPDTTNGTATPDNGVQVLDHGTVVPPSSTNQQNTASVGTAPKEDIGHVTVTSPHKDSLSKQDKFGIALAAVLAALILGVVIGVSARCISCRRRVQTEKKYNLYQDALATV